MNIQVDITADEFDVGLLYMQMLRETEDAGAIVTFSGVVRPSADGEPVRALELEHYPGMTERSVEAVAAQAAERWCLSGLQVIHRIGVLRPGDQIVLVLAASRHREAAFQAASFVMDYLKTRAIFWKREVFDTGTRWVESRDDDRKAAARWQQSI